MGAADGTPGGIRSAVVTGGSRGIGRAIAAALVGERIRVLLVSSQERPLRESAASIDPSGKWAIPFAADLADLGAPGAIRAEALRHFQVPGALFNVAGTARADRLERREPGAIDRELTIDLLAPVRLTRSFLPDFLAEGHGHFLHLGSGISDLPMPRLAVYGAAKSGLRSFSVALDLEIRRRGLRSTVLEPIYVRTRLGERPGDPEPPLDRYARRHPRFVLAPETVARYAVAALRRPRAVVRVPLSWGVARWGVLAGREWVDSRRALPPPGDGEEPGGPLGPSAP